MTYRENCEPSQPVERERREALVLLAPGSAEERRKCRIATYLWCGGTSLGFIASCIAVAMWLGGLNPVPVLIASSVSFSAAWLSFFKSCARIVEVEL